MLYLKLRLLIDKFLTQFFDRATSTYLGSFLFYHIVLKNGYGINKLFSLSGKNLKNLAKNTTNILAKSHLMRLTTKAKSMEELINLGLSFLYILPDIPSHLIHKIHIVSFQNRFELLEFLKLIKRIKPKIILEIGTAMGGTLFLLSKFCSYKAMIISVDLPEIIVGGRVFPNNPSFFEKFIRNRQKFTFIRSDSHDESTLLKIKEILKNEKIDLLYIDGDHSYDGVKKDFNMYKPLVGSGGLICLHDIVPGSYKSVGDVPKFWNEIRKEYKHCEIVEDWNQGGFGIGLLNVD